LRFAPLFAFCGGSRVGCDTNNFLTRRSLSTPGDEGGYAALFLPLTEVGNPTILASGYFSPKVNSKESFPLVISVKAIVSCVQTRSKFDQCTDHRLPPTDL
jgi:hypothetical protein